MKYIIISILSVLLTFTFGVVWPNNFDTREEYREATFGFPLPIFSQVPRGGDMMQFPTRMNLGSPWESPVHLIYGNILLDIIFFWFALFSILWIFRRIIPQT